MIRLVVILVYFIVIILHGAVCAERRCGLVVSFLSFLILVKLNLSSSIPTWGFKINFLFLNHLWQLDLIVVEHVN